MVIKLLDTDWKFYLVEQENCAEAFEKEFNDTNWKKVTIPHDWSVQYPMDRKYSSGTGYVRGGIGWYRKHFYLEEGVKGKNVFLRFDGVYKNSQVWINGYYLGKRPYGYSTFQYNITDFLCFGEEENVISVQVTHTDIADSRWFTGSGITRKVSLLCYDFVYPTEGGVFFHAKQVTKDSAELHIDCELHTTKNFAAKITAILVDPLGNEAAITEITSNLEEAKANQVFLRGKVENPALWSTKEPTLYILKVTIADLESGEKSLLWEEKVGIRDIFFDPDKGFFLNGKRTIFKGVCVHHDGGCLGAAMTKGVWRRRLHKLKDMGCNAIRMSHNPHMPELYDLCDELGFLVMEEAFDEWEAPKNKWHIGHNVYPPKHEGYAEDFLQWHEADLAALIRRDRNHPSIVMWSIGNEIDYPNDPYNHPLFASMIGNNDANKPAEELTFRTGRPNANRLPIIASHLVSICKKHDTTRPVTAALAFPELSTQTGYLKDLDVVGYNYKEPLYEKDHALFPKKPFLGSENSHSYEAWRAVTENAYISGQFLWTGIDYLGECMGWPHHGSYAGNLTTAGFEKANYYRRQSWWAEKPILHLTTARKEEGEGEWKEMKHSFQYLTGEEIEVRCYTNQKDVVLYLNEKEIPDAQKWEEFGCLCWFVTFEAGILKAVSKAAGVTCELETVSAPVQIQLTPVSTEDLIQLELRVLDEKNRLVCSDHSKIIVKVEGDGELVGLDNGDLSDVTEYTADYRCTLEGKLIIYVRRTGENKIVVTAKNSYLKAGVCELS